MLLYIQVVVMSNIIERYKEMVNNKNIKPIQKEINLPNIDPLEKIKEMNNDNKLELDLDSFVEETPITYLDFNFENNEKMKENISKHEDVIDEMAYKWGITPALIKAMMSIESAGKEKNLMQIQFNSWHDKPIKVYNFKENKEQEIILTENPEKYDSKKYIRITKKDLENPKTNISVGTAILAKSAEDMHYNIAASIQMYNMGYGNMDEILYRTALDTHKNREDMLSDQKNLDFTKHTNITDPLSNGVLSGGDPNYLADVLKHLGNYVEDNNYEISIKHMNNDKIEVAKVIILPSNYLKG